jgi:hypothetical protein
VEKQQQLQMMKKTIEISYYYEIVEVLTTEGGSEQYEIGGKFDDLYAAYLEKKRRDNAEYGSQLNPYNTTRYLTVEIVEEKVS